MENRSEQESCTLHGPSRDTLMWAEPKVSQGLKPTSGMDVSSEDRQHTFTSCRSRINGISLINWCNVILQSIQLSHLLSDYNSEKEENQRSSLSKTINILCCHSTKNSSNTPSWQESKLRQVFGHTPQALLPSLGKMLPHLSPQVQMGLILRLALVHHHHPEPRIQTGELSEDMMRTIIPHHLDH